MSHSLADRPDRPLAAPDAGPAAARLVLLAVVLALAAALALLVDLPVARFVKQDRLPGDLKSLVELSEAFAHGVTVGLIILLAAVLDRRGWRVVPRLAVSAFGAGLLANAIKLLVARQRPRFADAGGQVLDTFVGWLPFFSVDYRLQSFPSGHTATAVGLAVALSALYPRGWWLFASFAALAGFERIQSQSHFLSDVLVGASIGCLVGAACTASTRYGRWLGAVESPGVGGRESGARSQELQTSDL
ncbi:MAG: phosphatase PAP2 family protein [Planctomycetaceae bacterium]|nr:phosphatase PAP2 family protein [Planctomycetaceae bacterium]